jgi:glycosyltransferase involved in cell wall biosynthesis
MGNPKISVVVPVYREEEVIDYFCARLTSSLKNITSEFEIVFCLDPSSDLTESLIHRQMDRDPRIKLIKFSRRFGQPAATMAGIFYCKGERCVIIDADLQDPPELISDMYFKMDEGYDVVYAVRNRRVGETLFKKFFTKLGYLLINKMSDIEIPRETGDFRIVSRRVIEELIKLNDSENFLRGLVAFVGFNQTGLFYEREERYSGKSKYNKFIGSLRIAMNGLVGFSSKPLVILSYIGFMLSLISFLIGVSYFLQKLSGINYPLGFSSTIILICFFSGIQLLSIGVLGEYIARIYNQVKKRPQYIIDEFINFE